MNTRRIIRSLVLSRFNKASVPVVLITASLLLILFHSLEFKPIEKLQIIVSDVVSPVVATVATPFNAAMDSTQEIVDLRQMRADNIQLRQDNEKLLKWYEAALQLQAENQALRELLNVKADPALAYVTARLLTDAGAAFVQSHLLAVGVKDGVRKGSAVMAGHSLVGRVVHVGQNTARVLMITDVNSRLPVMVQNTRTRAILAGTNGPDLRLERLPPDSGLMVGQRIVTSGDGGQLPFGLPVGVISRIDKNGVIVKPIADIERMTYVQVIDTGIDNFLLARELTDPSVPLSTPQ